MNQRIDVLGLRIILLLLFVAVLPSRGSVVLFSSEAAWLATTTVSNTTGFEGIASPGTTSDFSTSAGLTSGGVNFLGQIVNESCSFPGGCFTTSTGYQLQVSAPGAFDGLDWGTGAYLVGPQSEVEVVSIGAATEQNGTLTASLPAGTTSVGFDLMSVDGQAVPPAEPQVCLSTGDCFNLTTPAYPGQLFVGFTSTTPLTSVAITIPDGLDSFNQVFLDNFAVGAAIPEPRGLSMMLLGLAALFAVVRHRRNSASRA
jgi:hypothetical protein